MRLRGMVALVLVGAALPAAIASSASPPTAPRGAATAAASQATKVSQNGMYLVRGLDARRHRLFAEEVVDPAVAGPSARNRLRESTDWGATFSADKGLPAGVRTTSKVLRFKSKLYLVGRDARTGRVGVYRATPTPGNEPLRWSHPTLVLRRGAAALGTDFNADSRYLYIGEYGDPKGGPRVYRSRGGLHWRTVFGPAKRVRHVHGIAPDP